MQFLFDSKKQQELIELENQREEISKTIEKCIQIDPKKRYRNAEELKKSL